MSVDCIVADDNPLLDFLSIKNLNLNLNFVRSKPKYLRAKWFKSLWEQVTDISQVDGSLILET